MSRKIVFLDRDGTINVDHGYVVESSKVALIPGSATAIAKLKKNGFLVVVASNQSAVGRGMASTAQVDEVNQKIQQLLSAEKLGAEIDIFLYSTSTPDKPDCFRKPATGLLQKLGEFSDFEKSSSWMIGDKLSDLEFGYNAGLPADHCLLVLSGKGEKTFAELSREEEAIVPAFKNLLEAVNHLLSSDV